jgi:hypothetical protein
MFQAQMINFLEATVIFLLMTNAVSIFAAAQAIRMASDSVASSPDMAHAAVSRSGLFRLFGRILPH